jgi:ribosomal-protein-alanine N-acetyltransferase
VTPRLRPGREADLPALVAIDASSPGGGWTQEAFERELALAWSRLVVAEDDAGVPVGFVVYWVVAGELELLDVAVAPSARRQGLGRVLVEHLHAEARAAGHARVLLEVRRTNEPARALYQRLGYVETGVRRGYYSEGDEDAILMEWRP